MRFVGPRNLIGSNHRATLVIRGGTSEERRGEQYEYGGGSTAVWPLAASESPMLPLQTAFERGPRCKAARVSLFTCLIAPAAHAGLLERHAPPPGRRPAVPSRWLSGRPGRLRCHACCAPAGGQSRLNELMLRTASFTSTKRRRAMLTTRAGTLLGLLPRLLDHPCSSTPRSKLR